MGGGSAFEPLPIGMTVKSVTMGVSHMLAIGTDDTLWSVGYNSYGQLGNGSIGGSEVTWQQVDTDVIQAWSDRNSSLYLKKDGSLWFMGVNAHKQAPNTGNIVATPRKLADNVLTADLGVSHVVYVDSLHNVWGRGLLPNEVDGSVVFEESPSPKLITTGGLEVSAGDYHTLIRKQDDTLWTFGANSDGQLGDGTRTSRATPIQVASDVFKIAAGGSHSLALTRDPPTLPVPQLEFSKVSLSAYSYRVFLTFEVGENEPWLITGNQPWLTVYPNRGLGEATSLLFVARNQTGATRKATIYINDVPFEIWQGTALSTETNFDQSGLFLSPGTLEQSISVESDGKWTVFAADDWISVDRSIGSGNTTMTISLQPFNGAGIRVGRLLVGDTEVAVTQHGRTELSIHPNDGNAANPATLTFQSYSGFNYRPLNSPDLINWTPDSQSIPGDDDILTLQVENQVADKFFLKLQVEGNPTEN